MSAAVHVICCQKGGVGKTTLVVNLAAVVDDVLRTDDPSVLVVNADPQGSAEWWAKRIGDEVPFDYESAKDPSELAELCRLPGYRHVFVDTPGNLEHGHLLRAALEQADDALVPIPPAPLAFRPAATTIAGVIRPLNVPFRTVVNDWDPRDGKVDLERAIEWIDKQEFPRTRTVVRHYKVIENASADGRVVTQFPPSRAALQARQDVMALALELGYGGAVTA